MAGTADSGFGPQVNNALSCRAQRLAEMGHATAKDGSRQTWRRVFRRVWLENDSSSKSWALFSVFLQKRKGSIAQIDSRT
jgi:hypothetical protein